MTNTTDTTAQAPKTTTPPTLTVKQANTFPYRMHDMLDTVIKEGSEHVVSWIPGNDIAFRVHKPSVFVESIMPRFFSQTKYKSFQRQCNLWGFERLLHGSEKGGYCHPEGFFRRGKRELVNKMIRRKIKRRPSSMEESTANNMEATLASSLILPPQALPAPVSMTSTGTAFVPQPQRSPSLVSLSSSHNSLDIFQHPPPMVSTSYYEVPNSPTSYYGNSSVGTTSLTASPATDTEGLYLPPPPPTPATTQDVAVSVSEPDALFMEGLSAFFEDGADISIVSSENATTSSAPPQRMTAAPLPAPLPLPPAIQDMMKQQAQTKPLQPKEESSPSQQQHQRRLSVELFVASRLQDNSEGVILDLLTDSESLQRSLEMELMCPVLPQQPPPPPPVL